MRRLALVAPCLGALVACGGGDGSSTHAPAPAPVFALSASPSHASMFGEVDVTFSGDLASLGAITEVTVGGIRALDVRASGSSLTVRVQGAPAAGAARVAITGAKARAENDAAFAYDPPASGAPLVWASFGASLTQGFQSGGLRAHGQTMSWDAQVARAAGVYLAPPLVVDAFLPPILPSAFVKDCNATWSQSAVAKSLLAAVTDPMTGQFDLRRARQDATLPTQNFAVGGATVADIIHPATGPVSIVERITELPDGDPSSLFGPPLAKSQVDRLVALDPDVGLSGDLLANDSDGAVTGSDDLHPEQMTPVSTLAPELATLAKRLGALHGHYFIGNLLPLDGLPNVSLLRAHTIAAGTETQASFDAKLATVKDVVRRYNEALAAAVKPYPNLHVVDLWTPTEAVLSHGVTIGGQEVTGRRFGGLLSLDFLHFSDTGYGLLANVFIDAIDGALGAHIPRVDLAAVLAGDALSPASLAADGVRCAP